MQKHPCGCFDFHFFDYPPTRYYRYGAPKKNFLKSPWTFENRFIKDEPISVLKLREEFSSLN